MHQLVFLPREYLHLLYYFILNEAQRSTGEGMGMVCDGEHRSSVNHPSPFGRGLLVVSTPRAPSKALLITIV